MTREGLAIRWVDERDELDRLVEEWLGQPAVAIDTEFVRERTYYPQLGLVQVGTPDEIVLVDPIAIDDLASLARLLEAPGVEKVVHSAGEDVEVLFHRVGSVPRPLFDTQIAAALAGRGASLGYQALVQVTMGVEVEKGHTRTNWLRRPLSEAQCRYAADDVVHLLPLHRLLGSDLDELRRRPWLEEECERLLDPERIAPASCEAHRRVKGGGRLGGVERWLFETLATWREEEARRRDVPRGFVFRDDALVGIARRRPTSRSALAAIPGIGSRTMERYGRQLLEIVRQGAAGAEEEPAQCSDPSPQVRELARRLRSRVRVVAEELGVPPEILASRRRLVALAGRVLDRGGDAIGATLTGWRRLVLEEPLMAEIQGPGREIVSSSRSV